MYFPLSWAQNQLIDKKFDHEWIEDRIQRRMLFCQNLRNRYQ